MTAHDVNPVWPGWWNTEKSTIAAAADMGVNCTYWWPGSFATTDGAAVDASQEDQIAEHEWHVTGVTGVRAATVAAEGDDYVFRDATGAVTALVPRAADRTVRRAGNAPSE